MKRFEYRVELIGWDLGGPGRSGYEKYLNDMGSTGWELVCESAVGNGERTENKFIWKREFPQLTPLK